MKKRVLRRMVPGILSAAMLLGDCSVAAFADTGRQPEELSAGEAKEVVVASSSNSLKRMDARGESRQTEERYVMMNIPYRDFYKSELAGNDVSVDGVSSATLNKTRTGSMAGGSYHVNSDGRDISGITFPVKVEDGVDLSSYRQVTDADSVEITVTNRGQTTTTTYQGRDALFERGDYAYYVLSEKPEYYKVMTADEAGKISFGAAEGTRQNLEAKTNLMTETNYGDYQVSVDLAGLELDLNTDKLYGVVLETEEGSGFGLRHLENIWRGNQLAWSVGFTTEVHGCPLHPEHYRSMMGQTIKKITYYTSRGIYEIDADLYVPVKFAGQVSVEDASKDAGSTAISVEGLPQDFQAEYSARDDQDRALTIWVNGDTLSYSNGEKGSYTLTVADRQGVYAPLITEFILYTEEMPAAYGYNGGKRALVKAAGYTDQDFDDYRKHITAVTVDGKTYSASGRGAVEIIGEDGTIKTDAEPFAGEPTADRYEITVSSTGYLDLKFVYVPSEGSQSGSDNAGSSDNSGSSDNAGNSDSSDSSGGGYSRRSSGGTRSAGVQSGGEAGHWEARTAEDGQVVWIYQSDSTGKSLYADAWAYLYNPYVENGQSSYGWFRFGADGAMETGWFTDTDGNRYYLETESSGIKGMALTGWKLIDGKWYYFRGWDGAPYGSLLRGGVTPDGYTVGEDGAWNGQ